MRSLVSDAIINGKRQIYEQYSIESFEEKRSDVIPWIVVLRETGRFKTTMDI